MYSIAHLRFHIVNHFIVDILLNYGRVEVSDYDLRVEDSRPPLDKLTTGQRKHIEIVYLVLHPYTLKELILIVGKRLKGW